MIERELKAVVADPDRLRHALDAAGAVRGFAGMMTDRRYDRDGQLGLRDEVLRIRTYRNSSDGSVSCQLGWKGPARVEDGYKLRAEHEITTGDALEAQAIVVALGYREIHAIDRLVEYYELEDAVVRLEWYPRMDVLVEVEGSVEGIERAVARLGIARGEYSADALANFAQRYESRTGQVAAVSLAQLNAGERPSWDQ
ncbi:MAG: class IV adenylate cyclase [Gemmatimonadales bacterium]